MKVFVMEKIEIENLISDLEKETVKSLIKIAKDFNIIGRHDMRKQQLIDSLVAAQIKLEEEQKQQTQTQQQTTISKNTVDTKSIKQKIDYLTNAFPGQIICFRFEGDENNLKTAKIIFNDVDMQVISVETLRHEKYMVSYCDVAWIKTGKRWPKGIYLFLKEQKAKQKQQFRARVVFNGEK